MPRRQGETMNNKYRDKILGCWLGKSIGGTLGMPYEGSANSLNLTFYNPIPQEILPNDDLDLQILWGVLLNTKWDGVVSYENFENAWKENIRFIWDEYGVVRKNLEMGIRAPFSGLYDNAFSNGLGAAIRSEIWACLAPGDPQKAVAMCAIDASVDHHGDGVYAEIFHTALESMAFVESKIEKLIKDALSYIPSDSTLHHAIYDTINWVNETSDTSVIRSNILSKYGSDNFTDVKTNLAFEVAALLLCNGDFSKAICTAVNFGLDADCTGASVGAIMGIINPSGIPEKWLKPIGENIVLSPEIVGITPPKTISKFTDIIISLIDNVSIQDKYIPIIDFNKQIYPPIICKKMLLDDFYSPINLPSELETTQIRGNYFSITSSPDKHTIYKIAFSSEKCDEAIFMICSKVKARTWIDNSLCHDVVCDRFVPAPHRIPLENLYHFNLKKGSHEIVLDFYPNTNYNKQIEVCFGLFDKNRNWLPVTYERL